MRLKKDGLVKNKADTTGPHGRLEETRLYRKNRKNKQNDKQEQLTYEFVSDLKTVPIAPTLQENKDFLEQLFKECSDCVIREFHIEPNVPAIIVFIDGLVNTELVNDMMRALMTHDSGSTQIDRLKNTAIPVSQTQQVANYGEFLLSVLSGDTGIIIDKSDTALALGMRGPETRSVNEPETEAAVRGPREGFVENIRINTSMLRRKLKTPHLKMKSMVLGKRSNTSIVISYVENLTDPGIVKEVERRLQQIDMDSVIDSGYVEELIQDNVYSPFPQVQYTERPDTVASALLQGRVAIIVDGSPLVLLVPTVFWQLMQANEDYYERFEIGTLLRWLRYTFFIISLIMPALYIAATTFHQDMVPTTLLLSIAAARESIPFPAVVEALIMEVTFEALREAGIRLPRTVGQAVSILGALVVGQAAVEAGIVSAPMVIVVSITGIASFTIPRFNAAIAVRMLRFPLMIAAAFFGIYGILLMLIIIAGHMANLRSFGIPYLSPVGPLSVGDLKDVLVRVPWSNMERRPEFIPLQDQERLSDEMAENIENRNGQNGGNTS